jgi:6-phosphogluconolactonase
MAHTVTSLRIVADDANDANDANDAGGAELARAAAEEVVRLAGEAVAARGRFTFVLSGGSTPRSLFTLLADPHESFRDRITWNAVHVFWGDERCVPPDHPDSNYRMAREALLDHVPIPAANVHRIAAENPDAAAAAALYDAELGTFFSLADGENRGLPRFDLILLGLGPDGHTASLFPGNAAVHETERRVIAPFVEKLNTHRITLTAPVLNHAAVVIFLVSGAEKVAALAAVIEGARQVDLYPAQIIQPDDGALMWLVDNAAAQGLTGKGRSTTSQP